MQMFSKKAAFYIFSGGHAFLLGLFPFFVPVFLWEKGWELDIISWVIAGIGLSFIFALWMWERLSRAWELPKIILLSFLLETCLVFSAWWIGDVWGLVIFAIIFGAYNCVLWLTQRVMFLDLVTHENTAKMYGNLQIFVFIILKIGIFFGGLLLEQAVFFWLFFWSWVFGLIFGVYFLCRSKNLEWPQDFWKSKPLKLSEIIKFRDGFKSKFIFLLDGPFLFLESWFWSLSLFWLVGGSFMKLGILVIGLSVVFSAIFWLLKNTLDGQILKGKNFYVWGVFLYALSWIFRGIIPEIENIKIMGLVLVCLMFFTAYFRLLFNKKFYDLALKKSRYKYLILKSYYSQFSLTIVFSLLGGLYYFLPILPLSIIYFCAGFFSLGYFFYGKKL